MTTPDESVFKIDAEVQRRYDHYSQVANQPHVFDTTLSFIPMEPNQLGAVGTLGALYSQSPYS
jgi:hypothetical protein